jgi:multimeric flavodoxin WrbA
VIVKARIGSPAVDGQVAAEMAQVLDRRGALKHPPVTLAVSDAVALAIAGVFRNASQSGQVLDRFYRTGSTESAELIEAAQLEQVFASPEGHAALYCLIGWVRAQVHLRSA